MHDADAPNLATTDSPFEAITRNWLKDNEARLELQRTIAGLVISKIFLDHEENVLNRRSLRIFSRHGVHSDPVHASS